MRGFYCHNISLLLSFSLPRVKRKEIIKIHGRSEHPSIMLEPETIFVSKDDCVVWFNRFTAEDIKVTFKEGKGCLEGNSYGRG